jgi:hypothetical protein
MSVGSSSVSRLAEDALLAQVGRAPIDFVHELVGLHDLGRLGESLADLGEEGDVAVRDGLVVPEARIGELLARRAVACSTRVRERASFHCWAFAGCASATTEPLRREPRRARDASWKGRRRPHAGQARASERTMSFDEFARRARPQSVVPVWRDCLLDTDTPVTAFAKLREGPFAFLLESAPAGSETWSRYTFLGSAPRAAWRLRDGVVDDWTPDRGWHGARRRRIRSADLDALIRSRTPVEVRELGTFWSGAVGFFAYDVVRLIERLPNAAEEGRAGARRAVRVHGRARDHRQPPVAGARRGRCAAGRRHERGDVARRVRRALAESSGRSQKLRVPKTLPPLDLRSDAKPVEGSSNTTRERYLTGVERIREYILAGDAFQVQLGRRIAVPHDFPSRCAVSRAPRAESVTVHVPPRPRRGRARGQLARAAAPRERRTCDGAPDRRHAAARRHAGAGRGARGRADRGREGVRRARDARRPRAERHRPRRPVRHCGGERTTRSSSGTRTCSTW